MHREIYPRASRSFPPEASRSFPRKFLEILGNFWYDFLQFIRRNAPKPLMQVCKFNTCFAGDFNTLLEFLRHFYYKFFEGTFFFLRFYQWVCWEFVKIFIHNYLVTLFSTSMVSTKDLQEFSMMLFGNSFRSLIGSFFTKLLKNSLKTPCKISTLD